LEEGGAARLPVVGLRRGPALPAGWKRERWPRIQGGGASQAGQRREELLYRADIIYGTNV
jgi:hypothetical protein